MKRVLYSPTVIRYAQHERARYFDTCWHIILKDFFKVYGKNVYKIKQYLNAYIIITPYYFSSSVYPLKNMGEALWRTIQRHLK